MEAVDVQWTSFAPVGIIMLTLQGEWKSVPEVGGEVQFCGRVFKVAIGSRGPMDGRPMGVTALAGSLCPASTTKT